MITEEEHNKLAEIHIDMQSNVYENFVEMGECSAGNFAFWYNWRMKNFPVEHITKTGRELRLSHFDIESVVEIMAEWIKNPFTTTHTPTIEPKWAAQNYQ